MKERAVHEHAGGLARRSNPDGHRKIRQIGTRNKFRFTGEALDPGTGLYYLRARYYDPSVGRFISKDPLAGTAALPLTRNRFAYVLSNPVRFKDSSGFTPTEASQLASAIQSLGFSPDLVSAIITSWAKRVLFASDK